MTETYAFKEIMFGPTAWANGLGQGQRPARSRLFSFWRPSRLLPFAPSLCGGWLSGLRLAWFVRAGPRLPCAGCSWAWAGVRFRASPGFRPQLVFHRICALFPVRAFCICRLCRLCLLILSTFVGGNFVKNENEVNERRFNFR